MIPLGTHWDPRDTPRYPMEPQGYQNESYDALIIQIYNSRYHWGLNGTYNHH